MSPVPGAGADSRFLLGGSCWAVRAVVASGLSDARSSQNCSSLTPPNVSVGHSSSSRSAPLRKPTRRRGLAVLAVGRVSLAPRAAVPSFGSVAVGSPGIGSSGHESSGQELAGLGIARPRVLGRRLRVAGVAWPRPAPRSGAGPAAPAARRRRARSARRSPTGTCRSWRRDRGRCRPWAVSLRRGGGPERGDRPGAVDARPGWPFRSGLVRSGLAALAGLPDAGRPRRGLLRRTEGAYRGGCLSGC